MESKWSKLTFANNLKYYMELAGKKQKEMAAIAGVSAPTFSDWLNAKKMPRMDKVQRLANYFGIKISDLLEEKGNPVEQAVFEARILKDKELMDMVKLYMNLSETKKRAVRQMVETLSAD